MVSLTLSIISTLARKEFCNGGSETREGRRMARQVRDLPRIGEAQPERKSPRFGLELEI